jgi:hypothetical protein
MSCNPACGHNKLHNKKSAEEYQLLICTCADSSAGVPIGGCVLAAGLGCRVHNAVLKTDAEGRASDVFWVTDLRGRKVGLMCSE